MTIVVGLFKDQAKAEEAINSEKLKTNHQVAGQLSWFVTFCFGEIRPFSGHIGVKTASTSTHFST